MTQPETPNNEQTPSTSEELNAQPSKRVVDTGGKPELKFKLRMKMPPVDGRQAVPPPPATPADANQEPPHLADGGGADEPTPPKTPPTPPAKTGEVETTEQPPPPPPPSVEETNESTTTDDGLVSYRFRPQEANAEAPTDSSKPPTDEGKKVVEPEIANSRLAVFCSLFLFLCGSTFFVLAFYGFGVPVSEMSPLAGAGILLAQLLFTLATIPDNRLCHGLARTMAGAATLLAALTAVSVLFAVLFLTSNLAFVVLEEFPSLGLTSVAAFLFAASLALQAENGNSHWYLAGFCLLCAGLAGGLPVHRMVAVRRVAFQAEEILSGGVESLPRQWALVEDRFENDGVLRFRHRLAPLDAHLTQASGGRLSLTTLESVAKRLQEEHRQRPDVIACMLSSVKAKPHQLRLLSLGNEKTEVLIVQTTSGVQLLEVSGKQEIFDRYESDIRELFAIMN